MDFDYDKFEDVDGYIYFYKNNGIIAVYNPFVGLCVKRIQYDKDGNIKAIEKTS